jgi:hypothetical protein
MILRRPGRGLLAASVLSFSAVAAIGALSSAGAIGCSSKSSAGFSPGGDDSGVDAAGDDGAGGGGSSSGGSGGSSSGFSLGEGGASSGGLGTGTCQDGLYTGTYQCSFDFSPDGGAVDTEGGFNDAGFVVSGPLSFTLMQSGTSGESFIDTASGTFGGTCCLGLFTITSNLSGMLNCNTGTFSGALSDGGYTGLGMMGAFSGPLSSGYDGTNFTFVDGTWALNVPMYGTCVGIWTANYGDQ